MNGRSDADGRRLLPPVIDGPFSLIGPVTGAAIQVTSETETASSRPGTAKPPYPSAADLPTQQGPHARFADVRGCRLTCAMSGLIISLLEGAYPAIRVVTHEALVEQELSATFYAHL